MFFNSKKKIADKIAVAVLTLIKSGFAFSAMSLGDNRYLNKDLGHFIPPQGFWTDAYIIGFIYQILTLSIEYEFNGNAMPAEKRGEIHLLALKQICGDSYLQAMRIIDAYVTGEIPDEEFVRGATDASSMYGAAIGLLKPDDPDPILQQARSMKGDNLCGNILYLTLNKHLRTKYLGMAR